MPLNNLFLSKIKLYFTLLYFTLIFLYYFYKYIEISTYFKSFMKKREVMPKENNQILILINGVPYIPKMVFIRSLEQLTRGDKK